MYNRKTKKALLVMMSLALLLMLFSNVAVLAQGPDPTNQDAEKYVHQVPKYPIVVDGVRYESEEITRFNGQPLIIVVDEKVEKEKVIYAFTTEEKAEEFAQESISNYSRYTLTKTSMSLLSQPETKLYRNTNHSGQCMSVPIGSSRPTLDVLCISAVSSVITAPAGSYTKLYDQAYFMGSQLWITAGYNPTNLGVYGWDNRAASIKVVW